MPYLKIKSEALDCYFDLCRDRGWKSNFSHEQILGSISYEFENVYDSDVEKLMFCVVLLVISGGWYPTPIDAARLWIVEILKKQSLDSLLQNTSKDDVDMLKQDMKALGLI